MGVPSEQRLKPSRSCLRARRIFADNCRAFRRAARLTSYEVADILGIRQPYLSRIENAKVRLSDVLVGLIADIFKVPPYRMLMPPGDVELSALSASPSSPATPNHRKRK